MTDILRRLLSRVEPTRRASALQRSVFGKYRQPNDDGRADQKKTRAVDYSVSDTIVTCTAQTRVQPRITVFGRTLSFTPLPLLLTVFLSFFNVFPPALSGTYPYIRYCTSAGRRAASNLG